VKPGVMKSRQCRDAGRFCFVIDEGAVALRYEEYTLDVLRSVLREVILEIHDVCPSREIPDPKSMAGLLGLPRGSPRRSGP
jgi:hypothetical protein